MSSALDELQATVSSAAHAGRWSNGLDTLANFVRLINSDPASAGKIYESRPLDGLCLEIARGMARDENWDQRPRSEADRETQVYVATELYESGGHTRVLEDFIAAQPGRRHLILLTKLHGRTTRAKIEARFAAPNVVVECAPAHDAAETVRWLAGRLQALAEARIFLFTHHEDAVAVTACASITLARLYFYHHADHHLALGLHLPGAVHLDLTPFSFFHCRDAARLSRVTYLPLTTPEVAARPPAEFCLSPTEAGLVTCSCGSEGKFTAPYDFNYFDLMAQALAQTRGSHVHIGPLSGDMVTRFHERLASWGVAAERVRLVTQVPSLAAALSEFNVSLYLGSWPLGGARAIIEALGTGTPVLVHQNYTHEYLGGQTLLPPRGLIWRTPNELFDILQNVTRAELQDQSRHSREHWEIYHRGQHLSRWLAPEEVKTGLIPSALPIYEPDRLRTWLGTRGKGIDF
ncbi:MAG: hypothetical protein ACR2OZ_09780, partial [Verrucomicrobiales bacterium]